MLDIKLIRKNPELIEKKLQTRDPTISLQGLLGLDEQLRGLKTKVEQLKAQRNDLSQKIGELKRKGADTQELMKTVSGISAEVHAIDPQVAALEEKFHHTLASLPNIPMDDIRVSQDPQENVVVKEFKQKPHFDFPFKNHLELNEKLHLFDFKRGAKLSGTGWPLYSGVGARLEWALLNYMIDIHLKNGFTQWIPPLLVKKEVVFGSGQLPKFENQQFKVHDDDYELYLIATAEMPLNGLHADELIPEEQLPLKYMAYTPCFRREAGAAGTSERGLIRMHQFNKVEMFLFSKPEESMLAFEFMLAGAEEILQGLELHHRLALLVTGDTSFAAARTIDVEVWLPGQNRYYEVSSISNCTDYQSRRSNIRYRTSAGNLEYVHTLNGSGLATSRLMVALLENHQQADGSIYVPAALSPYLGGLTHIR